MSITRSGCQKRPMKTWAFNCIFTSFLPFLTDKDLPLGYSYSKVIRYQLNNLMTEKSLGFFSTKISIGVF